MKTLVFRNSANSVRVEVQVDLFATNLQLVQAGFDTRFTNMYISGREDNNFQATRLGIDLKEVENTLQGAIAKAQSLDNIGLFAYDATYPNLPATAQVDTITLTGTSGTATVSIEGEDYVATFATDLATTATNFVTAHASDIQNDTSATVAASGDSLIFTAQTAGTGFEISISNTTTNLNGNLVNTTANQDGSGEITIVPTHHA